MTPPSSRAAPKTVAWLGYGGLVPFVALVLASAADPDRAPLWAFALLAYGAVILSFVGALHWGIAMVAPQVAGPSALFVWSVVPSLLGWVGLLVAHAGYASVAAVLMVGGFLAHFGMDLRLSRTLSALPGWYLPLRLRLTSVATLCLLLMCVVRVQP